MPVKSLCYDQEDVNVVVYRFFLLTFQVSVYSKHSVRVMSLTLADAGKGAPERGMPRRYGYGWPHGKFTRRTPGVSSAP